MAADNRSFSDLRQVTVVGNLVDEPKLVDGKSGVFLSFTVATNDRYTGANGETVENVSYWDCIVTGEARAEWLANSEALMKGNRVVIIGRLVQGTNYRARIQVQFIGLELTVHSVEGVSRRRSRNADNDAAPARRAPSNRRPVEDDDEGAPVRQTQRGTANTRGTGTARRGKVAPVVDTEDDDEAPF